MYVASGLINLFNQRNIIPVLDCSSDYRLATSYLSPMLALDMVVGMGGRALSFVRSERSKVATHGGKEDTSYHRKLKITNRPVDDTSV